MLTEFAERFMRLRQNQGYTQQKVAEKLGVTPRRYQNGKTAQACPMWR